MVRDRLERGAQRAHRAAAVSQPVHADPARAQPRIGGLLGTARPGGGLVALLVEQLGHLAPRLACAVGVAQPVARHLGDLPPEVPPDAEVALQPRPAPQRRDQRRPGLMGAVDAPQRGLGLDGRLVGQPLLHRAGEDLDQPALGPGRVGEPAELRPKPRLGGRIPAFERVLARPRLEGRGELPGPLAQSRQLGQRGGPLPGRHVLEPQLEQVGELLDVSGGPVDLLEQPGGGRAGAGARERAGQAGERRAFHGELVQHRGECVDRGLRILHALEQHGAAEQDLEPPDRISPPGLRQPGEHRGELLGPSLPGEDPVERLQRLDVAGNRRGQPAPGVELCGNVAGAFPGARRQAKEVGGSGAARRLGGGRVHVGQHVEPPRLLGEARDVGERLLPLPPPGGECSARRVERAGRIAEVHLEERPDLSEKVRPLDRILLGGEPVLPDREPGLHVGRRREDLIDLRQRLPSQRPRLAGLLEERQAHAGVVGVARGHLGEEPQGAGGVAQAEPPELGDPERQVGVEERRREPLLERPGQVGRKVELGGELLHLGRGRDVVRIAGQPLPREAEPLERVGGLGQSRQVQAGRHVGVMRQLVENLGEPVPVLGGLEGARRPGEQPGRLLARHEIERAPVGRDRRDRIAQPLEKQIAPLGRERGALGRRRLETLALREQVARLLPPLPRQRQPGEPGERLRVAWEDLAHPPELPGRLLLGPQLLLGELRRPDPQGSLLGGLPGKRVRGLGEERVELGVGPGPGGQVFHPAPGLGVGRRLAQRRRGGVERAAGVAEPVLADGRDVEPHARAVGGIRPTRRGRSPRASRRGARRRRPPRGRAPGRGRCAPGRCRSRGDPPAPGPPGRPAARRALPHRAAPARRRPRRGVVPAAGGGGPPARPRARTRSGAPWAERRARTWQSSAAEASDPSARSAAASPRRASGSVPSWASTSRQAASARGASPASRWSRAILMLSSRRSAPEAVARRPVRSSMSSAWRPARESAAS